MKLEGCTLAEWLREAFTYRPPPGPADPPKPAVCPNDGDALIWISPSVALCLHRPCFTPLWRLTPRMGLPAGLTAVVVPSALTLAHAVRDVMAVAVSSKERPNE